VPSERLGLGAEGVCEVRASGPAVKEKKEGGKENRVVGSTACQRAKGKEGFKNPRIDALEKICKKHEEKHPPIQ
jgi:hypothetical protein